MQVERIVERHEKWEPVAGITTPAARAVVQKDHEGLLVTMMFSEIVDGLGADLQMRFGRVAAYRFTKNSFTRLRLLKRSRRCWVSDGTIIFSRFWWLMILNGCVRCRIG